ncbi:MAG: hypothetical protein AAF578_00420 [Pseudomonadota bacterium]
MSKSFGAFLFGVLEAMKKGPFVVDPTPMLEAAMFKRTPQELRRMIRREQLKADLCASFEAKQIHLAMMRRYRERLNTLQKARNNP